MRGTCQPWPSSRLSRGPNLSQGENFGGFLSEVLEDPFIMMPPALEFPYLIYDNLWHSVLPYPLSERITMNYVTFFILLPHMLTLINLCCAAWGWDMAPTSGSKPHRRVDPPLPKWYVARSQAQTGKSLFSMQRLNSLTTGLTTG